VPMKDAERQRTPHSASSLDSTKLPQATGMVGSSFTSYLPLHCALHRIALPVVSEWCQEYMNYASPVPLQTGFALRT
jgi:hypothetical protein